MATKIFVPVFYVCNRQGMFLAGKVGDRHHPVHWVRDRGKADGFKWWVDADDFRKRWLPTLVQDSATIQDQNGDIWTYKRAKVAGVLSEAVLDKVVRVMGDALIEKVKQDLGPPTLEGTLSVLPDGR